MTAKKAVRGRVKKARPVARADQTGNAVPSARKSIRRRRWDQGDVRAFALGLPEVEEGPHFDRPAFRVRKKIFATLPPDENTINLKTTSVNLDALSSADPETFRDVWQGTWMSVELSRVDPESLRGLIEDAWRLAAPKRLAAAFDTR
jgi:hypothetical protein